ncbi:MAG TPA: PEP/pyruvate-binding domain-containing protein [bacterium]
MNNITKPIKTIVDDLQERAKELNCLYKIEELLSNPEIPLENIIRGIVDAIPSGWQYPDICQARIVFEDMKIEAPNFKETPWMQTAKIAVQDRVIGKIEVCYTEKAPYAKGSPFLKEEHKLLNTIAGRLGHFIMFKHFKQKHQNWETATQKIDYKEKDKWKIILDVLNSTDKNLYKSISRKMLNYLCWNGIEEAESLFQRIGFSNKNDNDEPIEDSNRPLQKEEPPDFLKLSDEIFKIASDHLSVKEILSNVQNWIKEDKSSFLVNVLENFETSVAEISDVLERFFHANPDGIELNPATEKGVKVSLIRRFFTEQLQFIVIAKNFIEIRDFYELLHRIIFTPKSHGKLGGKSAGLFLASKMITKFAEQYDFLKDIKFPKTWYMTSDIPLKFIRFNNLEDVFNQKYKNIDQVRQEYPNIVQIFKHSYFPPEIMQALSNALDDFGQLPLIVRSSSLLEDRVGAAFSGKYKSLFLANQGTKRERLEALMDAVAEVYASTFSPDPIEYRSEKGLLDFHEEMGIMIQEVVGTKVGDYFLPSFAGVAFSKNEFRWSDRIKREDGLIRVVPGLGTRAVDRVSDDYPILIAPGQPNLRVNVSIEEIARYSPRNIDVINLKSNTFETIRISDLLKKSGDEYPGINQIVSIIDHDHIRKPSGLGIDFEKDELIATLDGLITATPFVSQLRNLLLFLQDKFEIPIDIEFASDGKHFYLLQCRAQSYSEDSAPMPIPKDIPDTKIVFTANRHISNGKVPEITHIVYVDPEGYNQLSSIAELTQVGRAIGKLNKILPKRKFILMGPGRWGSRGDIKLGVNVTYSDISNTAVLIEIARKKGNYLPDLSFGTHFFQDLVESSIRYLPLYPDDAGIVFNENFLKNSQNTLSKLLPEYSSLSNTIHVIDVAKVTNGMMLSIAMNADLDKAVGFLK